MLALRLARTIELRRPAHMLRWRAPHELWVNEEAEGLCVLDLESGRPGPRVSWPPGVDEFCIYDWLFSPGDDFSYFLDSEGLPFCVALDHQRKTLQRIALPSPPFGPHGATHFENGLPLLLDKKGRGWRLDGGRLKLLAEDDPVLTEAADAATRIKPMTFYRMANDGRRVWFLRSGDQLGFSHDLSLPPVVVDDVPHARGCTVAANTFFIVFERSLVALQRRSLRPLIALPDDEEFLAIETSHWMSESALALLHFRRKAKEYAVQFYTVEEAT